jgi:AcrR family transcriptional regulator
MARSAAPIRSAGRQRDGRTDAALVDAVLDLVGRGATLSGISFVAIAEHAGVSRNSLYRRWKTKDALFLDVLASLNRPLPALAGTSVLDDVAELLSVIIERSVDPRASQMLRALNAEASKFPQLHRRYFEEVVAPRRAVLIDLLERGVERGDIAGNVDVDFAASVLVAPILTSVAFNMTQDLDPKVTSRQIAELVFAGLAPRATLDESR